MDRTSAIGRSGSTSAIALRIAPTRLSGSTAVRTANAPLDTRLILQGYPRRRASAGTRSDPPAGRGPKRARLRRRRRPAFGHLRPSDPLAQRAGIGPVPLFDGPADDDGAEPTIMVVRRERAPLDDPDAHRFEVPRRNAMRQEDGRNLALGRREFIDHGAHVINGRWKGSALMAPTRVTPGTASSRSMSRS